MCRTGGDGKQVLLKSVLDEVIITVERQLSDMDIFTDAEADVTRLEYAPVTNSWLRVRDWETR